MMYHAKIQFLTVWAYLFMLICVHASGIFNSSDEKFIIVNPLNVHIDHYEFEGSGTTLDYDDGDSCICSNVRMCFCTELKDALYHVENNTVVAINGTVIGFTANVAISNHANISIIGYHKVAVVNCLGEGMINFNNCNNITIENITWISCGNNKAYRGSEGVTGYSQYSQNFKDYFFGLFSFGLRLAFCTNTTIKSCTFKASMIGFHNVSGTVNIDHVHFLSTTTYNMNMYLSLATGLIIKQQNNVQAAENIVVVNIINSLFSQVEGINSYNDKSGLLLFYILVDDSHSSMRVLVKQTNFSSASYDPGWAAENGMVWIRILSSRNPYIEFNMVNFFSNDFQPYKFPPPPLVEYKFAAILSITSKSFSIIKIKLCTFLSNYANKVALFEGDMSLNIIDTHFYSNKADSVLCVTYTDKSWHRLLATAVKIVHSTFSHNIGSRLILLTGVHMLVNISGLQITNNVLLSGNDSLVMFKDYTALIAYIKNVNYQFNYIKGEGSGFLFRSMSITRDISYYGFFCKCISPNLNFTLPQLYAFNRCTNGCYQYSSHQAGIDETFKWISFSNSSFNNNIGGGHGALFYLNYSIIDNSIANSMISTCTFNNNSGYKSLIFTADRDFVDGHILVKDSTFTHNEETVFHITNQYIYFANENEITVFDSNKAQNGPSVYLNLNSKLIFTNKSAVVFSNNIARRYGGAIFYNITQSSDTCYRNLSALIVDNSTSIDFKDNLAGIAGNSIYFSISQSCNGTLQYNPQAPFFNQSVEEFATSPNKLKLHYPAQLVNNTDPNTYYVNDIMLGQNIIIPACTLDYNEIPLAIVQFTVQLIDNDDQNYSIQGSDLISIDCRTLQGINNLFITGTPPLSGINSSLTIQLNSFYDSTFDWNPITVNLNVRLSSCHSGFHYSSDLERCVCYTTDNIMTCSDSNSFIRNGYWFGTIDEQPTVTVCPVNYCNFDNCEATTGTCDLYPLRDNQCRGHRSGVACGNCEEGYTLSFDSIDCISVDQCTIRQTVLVITMSFLYWITVIVVVFSMMYFKIGIGYLYGITFYYSITDILLMETLQFNKNLNQFVVVLSSVAKLLPRFLGQLCFVKGLSGIDQQFIHYIHPLAVLLLLLFISVSVRFSPRLSMFVSRAVIHAICLLLLLSYTSIASTSLLLVRAIRFTSVDKVYSYLSPNIEYFHGRHLIYALVALLTGLVVVIGLPLLLSLEPFVNHKINFIKIKPLLDQFQGCYKDKFRYFASYYMIFRLIILIILVINATNIFITLYLLLVACSLMMFIHTAVRPYLNHLLNLFDSFVLLIMTFIITLLIIESYRGFPTNTTLVIAFALLALPAIAFSFMVAYLHLERIKKLYSLCFSAVKKVKSKNSTSNERIEMPKREYGVIVDDQLRDKSTTTM